LNTVWILKLYGVVCERRLWRSCSTPVIRYFTRH